MHDTSQLGVGNCRMCLIPFSAFWMKFISSGDGTHSLNEFFENVFDDVASYAALHYGHELNQQYGDLSMGDLKVSEFFYGHSQSDIKLATPFESPWVQPTQVFAAPRLAMDRHQLAYTEASARPTFHGEEQWRLLLNATNDLQNLLTQQKETQQLHWDLVNLAIPQNKTKRYQMWTTSVRPLRPQCELDVHRALIEFCDNKVDVSTSYALQFHQVVVNLCADDELLWGSRPGLGVNTAKRACAGVDEQEGLIV